MSSDIIEFGLDDVGTVNVNSIEPWKQQRPGEISRISIVCFKTFADCYFTQKFKETGRVISDDEKHEIIKKIDIKLAAQLNKPVEQLVQEDRLELKQPRLAMSRTHFKDGVGTIRCLSKYDGNTLIKPELCCEKMTEATQSVATLIMTYPLDRDNQIDEDLLANKKYTNFHVWKMSPKKYEKFQTAYKDAHKSGSFLVDLKVALDTGDVKYQKQHIEACRGDAVWANARMTEAGIKSWVLDQGLRNWKHIQDNLGYSMKREQLVEKLQLSSGSGQNQPAAATASTPQLQQSYDSMLD